MNVAIIYRCFFDFDGKSQLIGGVETYLLNLCKLIIEIGWNPMIFQCSYKPFKLNYNSIAITGIGHAYSKPSTQRKALFQIATDHIDIKNDILIFGSDHFSVHTKQKKSILIQHGIYWDLPIEYLTNYKLFQWRYGATIKKLSIIKKSISYFENTPNRVCVDYNYLNWYKTFRSYKSGGGVWVIPNFASKIADKSEISNRDNNDEIINIIFARRFTGYRGLKLMAGSTTKLLERFNNIRFTFAGEGPEILLLKNKFKDEKRVRIIKYYPGDELDIHLQHNIAVIPSLGSEGTSLSVAEAMAAGCAVVATPIGGITNMLIDDYNGKYANPDINSLTNVIGELLTDKNKRKILGERAYETAKTSFSLTNWKKRWTNVLEEVKYGQ
jgi:glycosyltransferase involved in cell wall biosynthesis